VLAVVAALLAPLALVSGAGAASAAGVSANLAITGFTAASGATLASPQLAVDGSYASDTSYTVSPPTSTVSMALSYRCASDTQDCPDAAITVLLDQLRLPADFQVQGLTVAPVVTYYTDQAATVTTTDPTLAVAFRLAFQDALDEGERGLGAGITGTLTFSGSLVTPTGGGTQTGSAVAVPSSAAGESQRSRVRLTGEFPVNLATTTTLTWAKAGYLSGVDDGTEQPTNTGTVVSTNTGDPATTLTTTWGAADPSAKPAAGTVGMLQDLTSLVVQQWPTADATLVVTGWTWAGTAAAPVQVPVATLAAGDAGAGADLLAGLDEATRKALTGLRLVFTAADGSSIPTNAAATIAVGVREHGSAASTPTTRDGSAVDYVTNVPAATFDPASDLNTLTVNGTATSVAARGSKTSSTSSVTRGMRVYDPRAYAGSSTSLAALASGGVVYGGGYVLATAGGTNWSRRAVEQLTLTVRPSAADVTATNAVLNPDIAVLDSRVFAAGLTFAGFGAARDGSGAGDGSGAVLTGLVGSGATLTITVTADGITTTPVQVSGSVASPALPTDPAAFGLTSWSQVTGFTVTASGTGAVVPMGASVSIPYLLRAATDAAVQTYVDHTRATTVLGSDTSSVAPRTTTSGNRPVTAASIAVQVPTVGGSGLKYLVEPYVSTSAGSTATAVLETTAYAGTSGHLPDTLLMEDSARATTGANSTGTSGAAWWDVMVPTSVAPVAVAGVTTSVQYYTDADPAWTDYTGSLSTLAGADDWRGFRLVSVKDDGSTFDAGTTVRARVTFAVRSAVLNGATWTGGTTLRNVARATTEATIEGNVVASPEARTSDTVQAVAPGSGGEHALIKVLSSLQGVEGSASAPTATLTWGTAGDDHTSVTVTDANGLGAGDGTPSTGAADSFWDTFDLTGVRAISSAATDPNDGTAYDPYLVFDQITDVQVYDALGNAWHSLRTEEWTGSAWAPLDAARTDVTFAGSTVGAFPYVGSFPGMTVSTGLRARVGGVRLVYEARTDRATALAAGDWRQALLGDLTDGAVASTEGPTREVVLALVLRDTARSTGAPVNDAFPYNGSSAGQVRNSGRVTGWTGTGGTGSETDLGGPINGPGNWTYQVMPASIGVTATKTWLRDANGDPLGTSTDLDQLAVPVDPSDPAAWPTATLTVGGASVATSRVDSLTLTEPAGIAAGQTLSDTAPFAQFAITDIVSLTNSGTASSGVVTGATDVKVVLYSLVGGVVTEGTPLTRQQALDLPATSFQDVVGVQVRYTGRIQANKTGTLVLSTRLLAENRVSGEPTAAGLRVDNTVRVQASDARICADETQPKDATTGCTPQVATQDATKRTTVRDPEVLAFPALTVGPVDVQRDATDPAVTTTMSVQNFGLTPADALTVTDADPRYFNAVGVSGAVLEQLPTGADEATLQVLLAGPDLSIAADGTYAGTQTWQDWGLPTAGAWDLAALATAHGTDAAAIIGVRVRFADTDGSLIPAPGQGYGEVRLDGRLREELLTGGLPSAVGAEGWSYDGAPELTTNPGETVRGRISNHVTAQAFRGADASPVEPTADVTSTVHAGAARIQVAKAEVGPTSHAPGDYVQYRITVSNTASGTGAADLSVTGPLSAPTVTADDTDVVLTWGADERLAPGAQVTVLIWLRIDPNLSSTSIVNVATAASASRPVVPGSTGSDGQTACQAGSDDPTSAACRATAGALVIGGANVYVSEEWVKDADSTGAVRTVAPKAGASTTCAPRGTGPNDVGWYRYPCSVVTTAGSTTQWQVQVTSKATVTTDRLEMVDMLSQVGDYPAMDGSGTSTRGSQWRPVWNGVVPTLVGTYPAGATLTVFTTTADYRSGGLAASGDFDPVPGTWTQLTSGATVPAAQAARVTGFKFVVTFAAGDTFSNGESVRVQWAMKTPITGATDMVDAWNSFAFRVPAGTNRPVDVTSVPLKAGARYAVAAAAGDPLVALGDRVWLDADRDGVQDPGEDGVEGVVVDLFTDAGDWAGETTTDADGAYLFDGLPAGTYDLRFTLPAALASQVRLTATGAGSDDTVDSDAVEVAAGEYTIDDVMLTADTSGLMTAASGLTADFVDSTRDVGLQWQWLSVGDRVWFDEDRDGVQDAGEPGVPGATVTLLDADGDPVGTPRITDADGGYLFDRLDPGTYRIQVDLPDALTSRWSFTAPLVGDGTTDSDVVADSSASGRTAPFTLTPGVAGRIVAIGSMSGGVYAGVTADYVDPTQDAGLRELPVRVGDRVWVDLDGDGVQGTGEPGLPGVVLVLTDGAGDPVVDASGTPVGPVTTDADGAYAFTGLVPGTYTVTVDTVATGAVLDPYLPTTAHAGGDSATDSSTGSETSRTLVGGESDASLDFGFRPLWAIGDRVWLDSDRDGVQDVGEPGFPDVTVRLLDAGGVPVVSTTTDADGRYVFDLLEPGDYTVEYVLDPADAARYGFTTVRSAAAWDAGADSDAVASTTATGTASTAVTVGSTAPGVRLSVAADGVTASRIDPTWDAGLVELPVSVGDLIWYDKDGDGIQDPGEPGIPGVVLKLTLPDGHPVTDADGVLVAPVTTDADGRFLFENLLPGQYVVSIDRIASRTALGGYGPTTLHAGSDPAVDSSTWTATSAVLVGGEQDVTLDFGMVLADDVQIALRKTAVARTATSITWDVTVASTGTQDAYAGFAVVDALPGSLTFTSASGTGFACTAVDQVVTCEHDDSLPAGETATVRIVTGVTTAGAEVTNKAMVNVDGRGYRFEVLSAQDVAVSDPVPSDPGSRLAATGATAALPLGAAVLLLVLGGTLVAIRRRRV
jgi:protocatechuate 3,4-dioxygenase beta subunit